MTRTEPTAWTLAQLITIGRAWTRIAGPEVDTLTHLTAGADALPADVRESRIDFLRVVRAMARDAGDNDVAADVDSALATLEIRR